MHFTVGIPQHLEQWFNGSGIANLPESLNRRTPDIVVRVVENTDERSNTSRITDYTQRLGSIIPDLTTGMPKGRAEGTDSPVPHIAECIGSGRLNPFVFRVFQCIDQPVNVPLSLHLLNIRARFLERTKE
ncbi:hypothetical protein DSECCO2_546490 [anaerobic digester metagenome]